MEGSLPSRVSASGHCHIEILNHSRFAKGRIEDAPADKAIKAWYIEPSVLCAGGNDDGFRRDFTAVGQQQDLSYPAQAKTGYLPRKYEFCAEQPGLLVGSLG
jgi:hypothetical protein